MRRNRLMPSVPQITNAPYRSRYHAVTVVPNRLNVPLCRSGMARSASLARALVAVAKSSTAQATRASGILRRIRSNMGLLDGLGLILASLFSAFSVSLHVGGLGIICVSFGFATRRAGDPPRPIGGGSNQ